MVLRALGTGNVNLTLRGSGSKNDITPGGGDTVITPRQPVTTTNLPGFIGPDIIASTAADPTYSQHGNIWCFAYQGATVAGQLFGGFGLQLQETWA